MLFILFNLELVFSRLFTFYQIMKIFKAPRFTTQILIILFAVSLTNCSVKVGSNHSSAKTKQVPPGQAKKMSGQKSAKNHAPGHNK
jgi:hypothetical protein